MSSLSSPVDLARAPVGPEGHVDHVPVDGSWSRRRRCPACRRRRRRRCSAGSRPSPSPPLVRIRRRCRRRLSPRRRPARSGRSPACVLPELSSPALTIFAGGLKGLDGSNTPSVEPRGVVASVELDLEQAPRARFLSAAAACAALTAAAGAGSSAGLARTTGTATRPRSSTRATGHRRFRAGPARDRGRKIFMVGRLGSRDCGRGGACSRRGRLWRRGSCCGRRGAAALRARAGGGALRLGREVDRGRQLGLDPRENRSGRWRSLTLST